MKIGLNLNIDVLKIDKARLFQGKKGTYLSLTTFIDTENKDQYDNNGFIKQTISADERNQGIDVPILGNCRVFYQADSQPQQSGQQQQQLPLQQQQQQQQQPVDDDIPF